MPTGGPVINITDATLPGPSQKNSPPSDLGLMSLPEVPATTPVMQDTQPVARRDIEVGDLPMPRSGENYPVLRLTQGMAKLLPSGENVLAVFFSNDTVMDARAINARTIAITGKAVGQSTLAIFKARNKKDVVGEAEVYIVDVGPPSPLSQDFQNQTPQLLQSSITTAIADPRIRATVFTTPNGGYVVQLKGAVRDAEEKKAADRIAELFGLPVASAVYVDPAAPTIRDYLSTPAPELTPLENLQMQLRDITGNSSIALLDWPTGPVMTGTVSSPEEAERVLSLVSGIGRRVTSFLRIPGATGEGEVYTSQTPLLSPDDSVMSQRMQSVTQVPSVYVVRTAFNALAITGTVRTRAEYDRVKKYASVLPQLLGATGGATPGDNNNGSISGQGALATGNQGQAPSASTAALTGLAPNVAPSAGYLFPTQIQMFVRITDPYEAQVRQVNIDTNVVEISRDALKQLGLEVGSAQLLTESRTVTAVGTGLNETLVPVVTRSVDPTFRGGTFLGGNGFLGGGDRGLIDPFRVRLNALANRGDVRILSNPNLTMLEGNEARLIVGGQRPIIKTTVNLGNVTQDVEFRPFGIILSARPTVGSDNTITLQINADVTELDFTSAIVVGGAQIPGERTRSVHTVIALKPGDTLVMGGLISNENRKEYSRVPLLSKIPILGKLFQSKRFVNNETELAIFMRPTLTRIDVADGDPSPYLTAPGFPSLQPIEGVTGDGASGENRNGGQGAPVPGR